MKRLPRGTFNIPKDATGAGVPAAQAGGVGTYDEAYVDEGGASGEGSGEPRGEPAA